MADIHTDREREITKNEREREREIERTRFRESEREGEREICSYLTPVAIDVFLVVVAVVVPIL